MTKRTIFDMGRNHPKPATFQGAEPMTPTCPGCSRLQAQLETLQNNAGVGKAELCKRIADLEGALDRAKSRVAELGRDKTEAYATVERMRTENAASKAAKNTQHWCIGSGENYYEANTPQGLIRNLHGALMSAQCEAQRNKEALRNRVETEMDRLAAEGRIDATLRSNDRTLKEKVKTLEAENAALEAQLADAKEELWEGNESPYFWQDKARLLGSQLIEARGLVRALCEDSRTLVASKAALARWKKEDSDG